MRILVLSALAAGSPADAVAMCNAIPGATTEFRAALGATNRPFASPGDFVRLRRTVCDTASPGFVDLDLDGKRSDDYVVTILFTPPEPGAPRNAVVLAEDCQSLLSRLASCDLVLGPGSASCVDVDSGPGAGGLVIPDDENLSFRFPDTDAALAPDADDRVFTGPAKIVVTPWTANELPCGLATTRCAGASGVVACVDELFEIDGTCRTEVTRLDPVFPGFTALPPPNSYAKICSTGIPGTPCSGAPEELRFTVDTQGNALVPIDWSGVRVFLDGVPVARLVRGETGFPAFGPGTDPVRVPGQGFLSSWSPEGIRLPPIFTPLAGAAAPTDPLDLFGTIDAPRGVNRIARRGCEGGPDEGAPCAADSDCSAGPCSELFEFRDDLVSGGVGPVVIPSGQFTAHAEELVPLDGLLETADLFAFAVHEGLANEDLNVDGDELDVVMTLGDRESGPGAPLGSVVRVRRPPFRYAAAVAEGDVLAYLEAEPHEGDCMSPPCDWNGDGDVADTLLRLYRSVPGAPVDLLGGNLCADADPRFEARPLALSDGLLFFRTREADCAARATERVTVTEAGGQAKAGGAPGPPSDVTQVLSSDGRFALFESMSTDVALGKTADTNDIFLRDRALGTTTWVSREASGGQANSGVHRGHLSADGSTVVFDSNATDLVAGMPTDGLRRIFVYDVATGTTTLLGTPDPAGSCEADEPKKPCNLVDSLSSDGRFVVFQSIATNVVPSPQPDGIKHVYLHDRALGTTEMIDVSGSQAANAASGAGAVSADGARVAFQSNATNLVVPDLNPLSDIFVRDRLLGTTSLVSVASDGSQPAGLKLHPSISPDGRHVAFSADGPGLVKGDTNALRDTFVRDLETGITERVSVSSQGLQGVLGDSLTVNTSLSEAGRFVAFPSLARTLVEGDTNLTRDVFVHDRATGITQRVSLRTDGSEASGLSHGPVALSADGQTAAFGSDDAFLIPGDTNRVGTPSSASRTRWIPRT